MNRLIVDYLRRWAWMLTLCAAVAFWIGWSIAANSEYPFEFLVFLVALWMGANLLNFDLRRGVARTVLVLPVTARQIGRSWWWATIPIPGILMAMALLLGAATAHCLHPARALPAGRLALASLFGLPWLGTSFIAIVGSKQSLSPSKRNRRWAGFLSLLSVVLLFGGMLTLTNATKQPFKFGLYLAVGLFLIVMGWFRAELCLVCLAQKPASLPPAVFRGLPSLLDKGAVTAASGQMAPDEAVAPSRPALPFRLLQRIVSHSLHGESRRYGGLRFLIGTTFIRSFLILTSVTGLMAILWRWQVQRIPQSPVATTVFIGTSSFLACWYLLLFQLMPVVRQLRLLRTLPISSVGLATALIAVPVLPLLALGTLVTGVVKLTSGTPGAVTAMSNFTLILAPAALGLFFGIWRAAGKQAYALMLVTLFGFLLAEVSLQRSFHYLTMPFPLAGSIAGISILLAFLLTYWSIGRSSHAYRAQADLSSQLGWPSA